MTTPTDTLVAQLQERLTALGDGRDARSDTERAAWWTATTEIQRCLSTLRNGPYVEASALLADCEQQLAMIEQKEAELTAALTAATSPSDATLDSRARDRALAHLQHLQLQRQALREGRLLIAPGIALDQRVTIEHRIAELRARIAHEDSVYAYAVAEAERLLSATVTG